MILAHTVHNNFNWFTPLLSILVGLILGVCSEPLRKYLLRPILRTTFTQDENCICETPVNLPAGQEVFESHAKVVRFYVQNTRRFLAKSCRAYLIQIEKVTPTKTETIFADRIPLDWAYIGATAVDIPGHTGLYCDLVGASQPSEQLRPHVNPMPKLLGNILRDCATYRFKAIIAGENLTPQSININVAWKGTWDIQDVWQN